MKAVVAFAVLLALAGTAAAQKVIYDTFNEEDFAHNLFDCCNVIPVSTRRSPAGVRQIVAIPFTTPTNGYITQIAIALSSPDGHDHLQVGLYGNSMGHPGALKWSYYLFNLPAEGQCCRHNILSMHIPVRAGGHYWLQVRAKAENQGGWNLNTIGASGPYVVFGDDGVWAPTEGPLPAVRIIER